MRKANRSSAPRNIAANNVHHTSATPGTPKESVIDFPTERLASAAAQPMSRKRRSPDRGGRDHFSDAMEWLMRGSLNNTFLTPMRMKITHAWMDLFVRLDAINSLNDELMQKRFRREELNAPELVQLKLRVKALGPIPRPSLSTMYRRKNAIPYYDILKAQKGKKFADREYRVFFPGTKSPRSPVRIDGDETTGPPRIAEVDIMFENTLERAVFRYGIEVNSITYQSQQLGELRRRLARPNARHPRVVLKITSGDPGCIYVLDPQARTYLKVPAVNQE